MSIKTRKMENERTLVISIAGKFDFSLLNEFRRAYTDNSDGMKKVIIDLRLTEAIDSSALGMLLNMKKFLQMGEKDISIINCIPEVNKVFQIAHFEKMFTLG